MSCEWVFCLLQWSRMAPPIGQCSWTHQHYRGSLRQHQFTYSTWPHRPGGVPGEWSHVCGFLKPPGSEKEWHIRMHGAFTIPFGVLGIRHTDQSCHHEVWVHLLHVNARLVDRVSRDDRSRRPHSRKRNSPYDHSKERRQHR